MMQRRPLKKRPRLSWNRWLLLLIIVLLGVSIWILSPSGTNVLNRQQGNLGLRLGLDLKGGVSIGYQAEFADNTTDADKPDIMKVAVDKIRTRVDAYGVTEPIIQQLGNDQIVVQLPGITDVTQAQSLIQQTAFLEFRKVEVNGSSVATLQNYLDDPSRTTFFDSSDSSVSGSRIFYAYGGSQDPVAILNFQDGVFTYTDKDGNTVDPGTLGSDVSGAYSWMPALGTAADGAKKQLTGAYLTKAAAQVNSQTSEISVGIQWNSEGADIFNQIAASLYPFYSSTTADPRSLLGIILDGELISSPRIMQSSYANGSAEITGSFTWNEAKLLAADLKAGQLPVKLRVIYGPDSVSPTLGADFVHKAFVAGLVGLLVVALFMILYYRLPGAIASLALVIYAVLVLAIYKLIPVTLSLAGVAGFVVSLGMAVDANVLIFERMKEELRAGRTLKAAMEAGFNRAWLAIRDSNISTFIACIILYWFGSSIMASPAVKGFAMTLFIGVAVSMFSAIVSTRTFLLSFTGPWATKRLTWFGVEAKPEVEVKDD